MPTTNDTKPLRYAELVLKACSHTYGVAPCTAALGVTGNHKCYNSPRTCQDPINFSGTEEQIIRWAVSTADLPLEIDATPCISSIDRRPQQIEPGEGLGVRESVTVSFFNFLHNDAGFDKYLSTRGYNTYNSGTYWGKFVARWGNIQGYEFRTVDGYVGQTLDEMDRRYYVVESTVGVDSSGKFSITSKDAIKFMDGDKAQAPLPSKGVLFAAIDEVATSLTLSPSTIGATYPANGLASIGNENVTFTRVGDVVTFTGRGLYGSKLEKHDAGETFQIALRFAPSDPSAIIYHLLDNYTDTPDEYLDVAAWIEETSAYIGRLYSADIMKPTPVKTLVTELIREVGLIFYTDLRLKKIALKAMRAFVPVVAFDDSTIIAGSLSSKTQFDKRVSDVWVYYGKRNPLEKQDNKENYTSIYADLTENVVVALEDSPRAIREIASRWITVFNSPAAVAVAESILARYEVAPRQVGFKVPPYITLQEGQAIYLQSRIFENDQGGLAPSFQCQILSTERSEQGYNVLAEEVNFTLIPPTNIRVINITEDAYNINLRSVHDSIYAPIVSGNTVRLMIGPNVTIGSVNNSSFALTIGSWPVGVIIEIYGYGIEGKGGDGDYGTGNNGGGALYTRHPITIAGDVNIWGGGGAGGAGTYSPPFSTIPIPLTGGGGAGSTPGNPGATKTAGSPRTFLGTGTGFGYGGAGGNPGLPGEAGSGVLGQVGGSPGVAIDGISYVTITASPDIRGAQIN